MKVVKVLKTTLKSALQTDGTSISVQAFVDSNGDTVALSDFGGSYFYVVLKQGSKIEIIKCDGITQNSDGSASLSVATSGRAIPPKSPFTGASSGKAFQTGSELIVTNDPATMAEFAQLAEDNAFTGANTFSAFPKKTGSLTPTDDEDFVTLAYLNSVVLGDAVVSALKSSVTFGEDVSEGDPVYFKTSDGKWWRAYADDASTCIDVQLGIADEDVSADATGVVVRQGRKASFSGLTNGKVYLTDAGGVSATAGSYVVLLGTAVADDTVYLDPKDGDREQFMSTVTGMIVPFAGSSVPSGFLACNGQIVDYTSYPDLWNVVLSKYGLGSGQTFTVTAANDTIDITSHGFSNGDIFILSSSDTLPAGLNADTVYYVVQAATNTFKLSLTAGGSPVDITDAGTGTHYLHTQFRVPDLRGSVVIGSGQKTKAFTFVDADVNTSTDVITVDENDFLYTGQAVALTTSGTLPSGLSATTYYVIRVSSTTIKLATSRANADDGTAVDITAAAGGGTHTLTLTVNATSRAVGAEGGEELHTLQTEELASHIHEILNSYTGGSADASIFSILNDSNNKNDTPIYDDVNNADDPYIKSVGSDTPHNNMPPYVAINFIIKT